MLVRGSWTSSAQSSDLPGKLAEVLKNRGKPRDRRMPGARLARSEGAHVTSERSGVVTWAANLLTARVRD
jgi:hypothetical protein